MTVIVRVGETVRRGAARWTPADFVAQHPNPETSY
jgi:hypothetical protein